MYRICDIQMNREFWLAYIVGRGYKVMRRLCIVISGVLISFILLVVIKGNDIGANQKKMVETDRIETSQPTVEPNQMDIYYGCYRIIQFCPTIYYGNVKYDCLPEQEADLMLGHIVVIKSEQLVTYDSERKLGTMEGRNGFEDNYNIEEYIVEDPIYECHAVASDAVDSFLKPDLEMREAVGESIYEQIENIITIPQLCSPYGTQYYYTLSDTNRMILYSTLSGQYFLMEKTEQDQETELPSQLSDRQKKQTLKEIYGIYEVTAFLPTKFYPAKDSAGYVILPQKEANMMLGQEIVITEDRFNTYDNRRSPNSEITGRSEDDFWIEKIEMENPEYSVKSRFRKDIHGLRDDMMPEELKQQEYIEIDLYPGYERLLPQLFLTETGKIMLYAMGEYFLLERKSERLL